MAKKFFQLPRLAQIILLILPVVGWIVELVIRWSAVLEKFTLLNLVLLNLVAALIYTFLGWGIVLQIVDIIWIILFKHLFLTKA